MRRTLLELFHAMEEMQPSILLADISFFISAEGFEIPLKVSFDFEAKFTLNVSILAPKL